MKHFLPFVFLAFSTLPVFAQITITYADFYGNIGKETIRTNYSVSNDPAIPSLIAQTGSGQVWDFSSITFTTGDVTTEITVPGVSGTPGASDPAFSAASHHIKSSSSSAPNETIYSYITATGESISSHGDNTDSAGTSTFTSYFTPAWKIIQFPVAMGTNWSSQTTWSSPQEPGFTYSSSITNVVDGEGQIKLPGGKTRSVLRIKQTAILNFGAIIDTTVTYNFMGKSDFGAASIIAPKQTQFGTVPGSINYHLGSGGGSVSESENSVFHVEANSPNPFFNETKINYSLKQDARVKIIVNDVLGREIATLVNERQNAGRQSISFNAKDLSPGQYYYTIIAEGMSITKMMTIIK